MRYTLQWPDDRYVSGVTFASEHLSAWGNQTVKWSNTWGRGTGYHGLNTGWRSPGWAQSYEVQFHTPSGKSAQRETHKLYEELRLPSDRVPRPNNPGRAWGQAQVRLRKLAISGAIWGRWSSRAKWPVSNRWSSASGRSRR
ncbi:hypothetical protein [Streptomyces sp. SDr-06]|uniref:hypothetical protein n=1 Tax=Streptomyces sp. SDr-06 TaxID=2267702 RepID=UPI00269F3AEA